MYDFKENTIVITNNYYKKDILTYFSENNIINNVKFMTLQNLIDNYYFTYDLNAIYYLINKYHYKYDLAKNYLNNLIYLKDDTFDNNKLIKLTNLKKELKENDLLIYNPYFKNYIKGKKLVFIGFSYFTNFEKSLIKELGEICETKIINKEENNYQPIVYSFDTLEEEVTFVLNEICKLLEKDIPLSKIKVANVDDEYLPTLKSLSEYFNLSFSEEVTLLSTNIAQEFLDNFTIPFNLSNLKEKYSSDEINTLVKILNKYISFSDEKTTKEMLINDLKNTKIKTDNLNTIEVIDYLNTKITDDDYVFLLNFNLNKIPVTHKDEEYLSDNIKEKLSLDTSISLNNKIKNSTIRFLKSTKNLTISYKKSSFYSTFYPSNLIDDLSLKVQENCQNNNDSYSTDLDKINLTKKIDNLIKYGAHDKTIDILYNNYEDIPYNSYNNKYKKINENSLYDYLDHKLTLSYSNLSNYYKCSFMYYLSNILKLDIYEETFNTYLGSLFHHILEIGLKNEIDVNLEVDKYIENNSRKLTNKELYFVNNSKKEMTFILDQIKEANRYTKLNDILFENKIEVSKSDNKLDIVFKGFIDKLMYKTYPDKTIMAIIDYKTGETPSSLSLIKNGINMQLPIYLYLASHTNFPNIFFAGFYIKQILNKKLNIDKNKSYEAMKKDLLKLQGYSNIDQDIISQFDSSYESSNIIKSLKTTNDGNFYHYSKVISDEQINNLISLVDSKINEAISNIENANFSINPKKTDKGNLSCKFCKFKDICYMTANNELLITEEKDLSFLGGDIDD